MYVGNVNRREGDQKNWWILKNVRLGFTCLTFFFFKEKKLHEWKKTTTSVYSICKKKKKWPVLISCFYATRTRIQCGAWPYLNTCEAVRPFRANTTMLHSGYRGPCLTIRCHELALPPFFSRIKTSLIWESPPPSGIGGASFPRRL